MKNLRFHRSLTPKTFESIVYGSSATKKSSQGWSEEARLYGIFIDLSKVEFAEFSALAQIALLVENAARHSINVKIALPLAKPRKGETRFIEMCKKSGEPAKKVWAESAEKRILRRKKILEFMRYCGFRNAIKVSHVPESYDFVDIDFNYDRAEDDIDGFQVAKQSFPSPLSDSDEDDENYYLSSIFPLGWFAPMTGEDLMRSKNFAAHVLHFKNMGISERDAKAIVGTVFCELIENVYHHAREKTVPINCEPYALVGAIALDPGKYKMKPENFRPCLQEFVKWSTHTGSPVIRIVVGDSGNGIPRVLSPYFRSENEKEIPHLTSKEKPLRKVEKILFWSFNRWSTSNVETALIKRGTRGLWLVQRFVRSYHGMMSVRAEDAMLGLRFEDQYEGLPFRDRNLRFIPGTLLDVCLLPQVPIFDKKQVIARAPALHKVEFAVVNCEVSDTGGLSEKDQEQLVSHLAKATVNEHKCVIASLDVTPLSSRAAQDVLIDIIRPACELANPGALAIVCTGFVHQQIEVASESIEASREDLADSHLKQLGIPPLSDPVLLLDARGNAKWFGGNPDLRRILEALQMAKDCELDGQTVQTIIPDSEKMAQLYRWFRDQPDLVREIPNGGIGLRFTIADINDRLLNQIQRRLGNAVQQGQQESVRKGEFRTPTLQYVKRWINVEQLLKGEIGIGLASCALARKLEFTGLLELKEDISLVRVDTASSEITFRLSECLGVEGRPHSMPGELDAYSHPEVPQVPHGTRVVLCADLILSGNTVTRAISELLRWEVEPVAVACVLDARTNKDPWVNCLGRKFPLTSLAEIDVIIQQSASRKVINIDPVLREPISSHITLSEPEYEISPDILLQWCQEQDGTLCFGHIERSIGRHFTSYLNAEKLFEEGSPHSEEILDRFINHVVGWLRERDAEHIEIGKQNKLAIEIWYPGTASDFAGKIATRLRTNLLDCHPDIWVARMRGIRRAVFAGRWVFPQEVEPVYKDAHVFIIDWGSMTAHTVQQMMRLSAEAGAASVKTMVFLSQMPIEDEIVLRRVPAIKGVKWLNGGSGRPTLNQQIPLFEDEKMRPVENGREFEEKIIPAKVVFLSALRLGYYPPRECPICKVREALENEEHLCPTELLREHGTETKVQLKQKEREEVFRERQRDLYGMAISSEEIADILKIKRQLEMALRSTEKRECIRSELVRLQSESNERCQQYKIAWIRLLATEAIWLKLPPLRFDDLRKMAKRIAMDIALGEGVPSLDHRLRRQGIIVLRGASKDDFVRELPRLLESSISERGLVQQMFYETFTYLRKPYHHQSAEAFEGILRSLRKCRDYLRGLNDEFEYHFEYIHTVSSLIQAVQFLQERSGFKEITPREAWRRLQERYQQPMLSHHSVIGRIFDIIIPLQEPIDRGRVPEHEAWKIAMEAWEDCNSFLSTNVLPFLSSLKKVLLGEYFVSKMRVGELEYLSSLMEEDIPYQGLQLSQLLYDFAKNPQLFLRSDKREKCKQLVDWWYKFFLKADVGEHRLGIRSSRLLQFLAGCPSNLKDTVEKALLYMERRGYAFDLYDENFEGLHVQVFCAEELLVNTISHIIENAAGEKHADPRRKKDVPTIFFDLTESDERYDKVVLKVFNDGTRATYPIGQGLRSLDSQLRSFDACVQGQSLSGDSWSYQAEIHLLKE